MTEIDGEELLPRRRHGVGVAGGQPHGRLVAVADAFEVLRTSILRIEEWFEQPVG